VRERKRDHGRCALSSVFDIPVFRQEGSNRQWWPVTEEERREFFRTHTQAEVVEALKVSNNTVQRMEHELGVYCKRFCQYHREYHFAEAFEKGQNRQFKGSCRESRIGKTGSAQREAAEYEACKIQDYMPATFDRPIPYPCSAASFA